MLFNSSSVGNPQRLLTGRTPRSRSTTNQRMPPTPRSRRRSPPSHVIHTVHQAPTTGSESSTNFLNRVCSRAGPGNDQVNEPQSSGETRHYQDPSQGHAT